MADQMWANFVTILQDAGLKFETGLTDAEIAAAESRYAFRFPPDLRDFLQAGLPSGESFPDWRDGDEARLREWFDLPLDGILFDIEHNGFWLAEWGVQPPSLTDAKRVATELVANAPKLIPIFMHRMIPAEPHLSGNPIFSVHQTDIIYYGIDLRDYLIREFLARGDSGFWPIPENIRQIRFWDLERFQNVRWGEDGSCVFDNSKGLLP